MSSAEEHRTFTCVSCPVGCELDVCLQDGEVVSVSGNACKRGETYGRDETTCPKRMVTSLVDVSGSTMPLSVRTAAAVPKARIPEIIATLRRVEVRPPVHIGDVIAPDICGTGVDVIATRDIGS
jgi:CxxC motif-containing protein